MLDFLDKITFGFFRVLFRLRAIFFPFVAGARWLGKYSAGVIWGLRLLMLAAVIIGLWLINEHLIPETWIVSPISKKLQSWWLPILFVLAYVLVVLGLWLVRLLSPEAEEVEFTDIKQAWEQAQRALNQAGIDLTEAPLFLILGRPTSAEQALFDGANVSLQVRQTPAEPGAPLHVYGDRDGIYVMCTGSSLLGRQTDILSGQGMPVTAASPNGPAAPAGGDDIFKTLTPQGKLKDVQAVLARARDQGRNPDQLTDEEKQEIRLLMQQENIEYAQQQASRPRILLLKQTEEVALQSARLRYLCRLIVRDRQPYCPLNGILVAIPYSATDSREDAEQTGGILQHDLITIRRTMQVQCPVFALVCDLETAQGFDTFLERFPTEQRQRRVGQRYPLLPDLAEGQSLTESVDKSVQWIASALIPTHIYRLFRVETSGREEPQATVVGNVKLYHLLGQLRERQKRLSGLVVRGLATEQDEPYLFGGCYLAATGAGQHGAHAFLPGVMRRLIENQSFVSWTEAGKREDESYRRWTTYGYTALTIVVLIVAAIVGVLWFRSEK